jgi:hypothetical protein
MIFDNVHLLFRIRIRIHNLKLRIRILQKVTDPDGVGSGSGSTTLLVILHEPFLPVDGNNLKCHQNFRRTKGWQDTG